MNKASVLVAMMALAGGSALGGQVTFEPDRQIVDPDTGVTTTSFVVSVSSDMLDRIASARLLFTADALVVTDFMLDADFRSNFDLTFVDTGGTGTFFSGINVEVVNLSGTAAQMLPAVVGTLTVETAGLAPGEYTVAVNADADGGRSVLSDVALPEIADALFGSATVAVIPGASIDTDGDGAPDITDDFPIDPDETVDTDMDGVGNNADADDDNDGTPDDVDVFPLDPNETADSDQDGIGNNADLDDDNDGVPDIDDAFPFDPNESADADGDGIGDNADMDSAGPGALGPICGMGMLCAFPFTLAGLMTLRRRRFIRPVGSSGQGGAHGRRRESL